MRNRHYLLILTIILFSFNGYAQNGHDSNVLNYTFELNEDYDEVGVTLIYKRGSAEAISEFTLPRNFDNSTFDTLVIARDIKLNSKGELVKKGIDTYLYIGNETSIEISYIIPSFSKNSGYLSCKGDDYFLPVMNNEYFHFYADKALILPESKNKSSELFEVRVDWINFPKEWEIASDFGVSEKGSRAEKQVLKDLTLGNLGEILFFGGNYRKVMFKLRGINFHTFIYGQYSFPDSAVIHLLSKVAESNMEIWQSFDHGSDYVISLTQKGVDCGRIGGRNMYNSFAIYMSSTFTEDQLPMIFIRAFTHEFTHSWIGTNFISNNEDWEKMRWFAEGFCEYYAILVNVKAGIVPADKFKVLINQNYIKYKMSPYANSSNDFYAKNYHYSSSLAKLAYTKGAAFAFFLDGYIRSASNAKYNLTDLMIKLLNAQDKIQGQLDIAMMSEIAQDSIGIDISDLLEKYITEGEGFTLESPMISTYFTKSYPTLDYGFDLIESANHEVISGVGTGSEASINGLKNGQKLISIKSMSNNPSEPIKLEVEENEQKIIVEYLPKGEDIELFLIEKLFFIE